MPKWGLSEEEYLSMSDTILGAVIAAVASMLGAVFTEVIGEKRRKSYVKMYEQQSKRKNWILYIAN